MEPILRAGMASQAGERVVKQLGERTTSNVYATLFNVSRDAILLIDTESGIVLDTNTALEELLKRTRDSVVGQHYSKLHPAAVLAGGALEE